jgi:cell division protein FtsL
VILRFFHLLLVAVLITAAVTVYEVKYQSTYDAQRAAKLRAEIRGEQEKIAALQAQWNELAAPARIQDLATRHLGMQPLAVTQFGEFATLPDRPAPERDPIGDIIESLQAAPKTESTGSIGGRR